jgi:hypothetical protein
MLACEAQIRWRRADPGVAGDFARREGQSASAALNRRPSAGHGLSPAVNRSAAARLCPLSGRGHATDAAAVLLEAVRQDLAALRLPLSLPGAERTRLDLRNAVNQLDDYILPRLRSLDAPLLAVVGGSTGAGKSTLVEVSRLASFSAALKVAAG